MGKLKTGTWQDVLDRKVLWSCDCADVLTWLNQLPADCVDLVIGSPPYEQARLYLEEVCDPFSGSGTTLAAALAWHRRFIGCEIRRSQVDLIKRRAAQVQPVMFKE